MRNSAVRRTAQLGSGSMRCQMEPLSVESKLYHPHSNSIRASKMLKKTHIKLFSTIFRNWLFIPHPEEIKDWEYSWYKNDYCRKYGKDEKRDFFSITHTATLETRIFNVLVHFLQKMFSRWRCVCLCHSNQRFLMKTKIGTQPSRKPIRPGVDVRHHCWGRLQTILWMGGWRKTSTYPRLTSSVHRLACEDLPHAGWKPLVEVHYCPTCHYLESVLFSFFSPFQWVLSFCTLWTLNPRQQNETQEDISNSRIKAQSDVWKWVRLPGNCQIVFCEKMGKKDSQTIIFSTLNFSWSQEQKKTAERNQDYNRHILSKKKTSTCDDFNKINKSADLLQLHKLT